MNWPKNWPMRWHMPNDWLSSFSVISVRIRQASVLAAAVASWTARDPDSYGTISAMSGPDEPKTIRDLTDAELTEALATAQGLKVDRAAAREICDLHRTPNGHMEENSFGVSRNEVSRRETGLRWGSRRVGGLTFSHSEFDSGGRHSVIEDADSSR
jgi:hypothetical protein